MLAPAASRTGQHVDRRSILKDGSSDVGKDSRRLHDPRAAAEDPADAAAAGHLPGRLADPAADRRYRQDDRPSSSSEGGGSADCLEQVAMFSASQLEPGHDLRPGHHALHLGLDYLPAPGQRLAAARRSCRRKARAAARRSTNTPAMPPSCSASAKAGSMWAACIGAAAWSTTSSCVDGDSALRLAVHRRADDDRRHRLPDVARRADRRVRHRQRHQPVDHGRHPGPHARRRLRAARADARDGLELGGGRRQDRRRDAPGAGGPVRRAWSPAWCSSRQGQRRIPTQSAKHVRGRRVYGGTRQYLPLRVNQAGVMPIIFASSLLLFPTVLFSWLAQRVSRAAFWHGLERRVPARRLVHLQRAVRRA